MRLIDADKLFQEVCSWSEPVIYKDWVQSVIANAPTIFPESLKSQGRWIRVENRLPEPETRILALTENKHVIAAMYEDGTIWRDASRWNFYDLYGFEYDEEKDDYLVPEGWWEYSIYCREEGNYPVEDKVTHWMSLPELPECRGGKQL